MKISNYCAKNDKIIKQFKTVVKDFNQFLKLKQMFRQINIVLLEFIEKNLSEDFLLIYKKTFVEKSRDSKWYLKYFSKATYYRKLNQLIKFIEFLFSF
ncbi:hypothetical protein [[Mycoplasma] anseris]|uniref:Uncharacterized protein n=1 Tax=[Mycoplasma] anseris TaxID=92400 RepID=A0A2Z4NCE2_9BACT|nr:hypothetical protein [[Mycoplasma] anseris]AWX69228.1 hypothetical protein DP065_00430 [[Mycoplasma] anseris]